MREVEDLEVLMNEAGGSAYLYGHSSGGALALEAALQLGGEQVKKLAIYEVRTMMITRRSSHGEHIFST